MSNEARGTADSLFKKFFDERGYPSLFKGNNVADAVIEDRPYTGYDHDDDVKSLFYLNYLQRLIFSSSNRLDSSLNSYRSHVFPPLETRTLLSEKQLQGHGLRVVESSTTDRWLVPIDSQGGYLEKDRHPDWYHAFLQRLDDLREIAREESLELSEISVAEATEFAAHLICSIRPSVFLIGNGNIRLRWSNAAHEQIGIQFLGGGLAQFVFFMKRQDRLSERFGTDTISEIAQLVSFSKLDHLWK